MMLYVLPALTFFTASGEVDLDANDLYARAASSTRADRFLLFGSTGEGSLLSQVERRRLLSLWRHRVPERDIVVCGFSDDPDEALEHLDAGLAFMVAWPTASLDALAKYLKVVGGRVMLYSHPSHTPLILNAANLSELRDRGVLPQGAKLSKIDTSDLAQVRDALPRHFRIWDGSDRRLRASHEAGADGVVSQMLAPLSLAIADSDLDSLQLALDGVRASLGSNMSKVFALKREAAAHHAGLSTATREP